MRRMMLNHVKEIRYGMDNCCAPYRTIDGSNHTALAGKIIEKKEIYIACLALCMLNVVVLAQRPRHAILA